MTASALAAVFLATGVLAQDYPARTVRVIVPTGPNGCANTQGRLISKRFSESMGQSFFVDNRPGAAGIIGSDVVAKAPADGYTLLVTSSLIAVAVGAAACRHLPAALGSNEIDELLDVNVKVFAAGDGASTACLKLRPFKLDLQ